MTPNLVVLLQMCDSLFPIGSFAHSDGLEAATAQMQIRTGTELAEWIDTLLSTQLRFAEGPAVAQAWRGFAERRFAAIVNLDDELYALRPSSAGRDSTRAMGARLLKTWQQLRPHDDVQTLTDTRRSLTLAVAFGVVAAASRISLEATLEGFMYTRLAASISAAMRLLSIGQLEAHRLLAGKARHIPAIAAGILETDASPQSFAPAMDVATMGHQYVQSKLFRS